MIEKNKKQQKTSSKRNLEFNLIFPVLTFPVYFIQLLWPIYCDKEEENERKSVKIPFKARGEEKQNLMIW